MILKRSNVIFSKVGRSDILHLSSMENIMITLCNKLVREAMLKRRVWMITEVQCKDCRDRYGELSQGASNEEAVD